MPPGKRKILSSPSRIGVRHKLRRGSGKTARSLIPAAPPSRKATEGRGAGMTYLVDILRRGGVAVILTDTIYGVVGSALSEKTVSRIYRLKGRNKKKPFIILISGPKELERFGVKLAPKERAFLSRSWPLRQASLDHTRGKQGRRRPVSVILPVPHQKFEYLHRGTRTLAFRVPGPAILRALLRKTGPLVAPSANPEGSPPARSIRDAEEYFGPRVDLYVDGGRKQGRPSRLVAFEGNEIKRLR